MQRTLVRYTVKPDQAARNEELVRAVYVELDRSDPGGLRYATFVLDDGVSFVHLASVEREDGHNPLDDLSAFSAFLQGIGERCDQPPLVSGLRSVGSYGSEVSGTDT